MKRPPAEWQEWQEWQVARMAAALPLLIASKWATVGFSLQGICGQIGRRKNPAKVGFF